MTKNLNSFRLILLLLSGSIIMHGCEKSDAEMDIDVIVRQAKVWTGCAEVPWAQALAIKGEKILAIGDNSQISAMADANTRVIDAENRLVIPGFNDAHVHFRDGGFSLIEIKLRDARTAADFAERIKSEAEKLPPGTWITGGNWDHEAWEQKEFPTKELIDPFTKEHPVLVNRLDGHVALANSLALRLAGITKTTPDPQGGMILKDPLTGEPTGILRDAAMDAVYEVIPPKSKAQHREAIVAALRHAAEVGITSIQDNSSAIDLQIYQELLKEGKLTIRVNAWRSIEYRDELQAVGIQALFGSPSLRIGCLKVFSDGSMGAGSALFFEPYADEPATSGLAMYQEHDLQRIIREADAAGLQVATHAIGDKANHIVLDAYEKAMRENGSRESRFDPRHRIEHAQVVTTEDLPRFKELGVIASIQPSHCIDDMRWAEKRIGEKRCHDAYRFKSLLDAGANIAFGTDWPVEPLNPMLSIYAAVTREFPEGGPEGGWHPEEKLTLEQALSLYTRGSAYAEFAESIKGTLEPGKLADFVILSKDLFEISPREILETTVVMTVVGGKVIFEGDSSIKK
ncbi:amidohydrolase [candidate division KSB1 bacterium]|nr:amidohydrolase [candidate division KSB1 bacterium]